MRTYFDQNRIMFETERRWHAADMEYSGGYIQVCPAVATRMAPRLMVGAWGLNERRMQEDLQRAKEEGDLREVKKIQQQRWWNGLWRTGGGLYQVAELNKEERTYANNLLGKEGLPQEAFRRQEGPLEENNDAAILAEVIAKDGIMLITSDKAFVDEVELDRWTREEGKMWGITRTKLVYQADDLFVKWAENPRHRERMLRSTLGAWWPTSPQASEDEIKEQTERGLERLRKGHLPRIAAHLQMQLEHRRDIREVVEEVRNNLPQSMRRAEQQRTKMFEEVRQAGKVERVAEPAKAYPDGYAF